MTVAFVEVEFRGETATVPVDTWDKVERLLEISLHRFCMECGTRLPVRGGRCPCCGVMPSPSRQDVTDKLVAAYKIAATA